MRLKESLILVEYLALKLKKFKNFIAQLVKAPHRRFTFTRDKKML